MASAHPNTLLSLPISPRAPIYHLPPDPLFPSAKSLLDLAKYDAPDDLGQNGPIALKPGEPVPPSMLRRSRQIRSGGCFTYTSPLPIEFPYNIREEGAGDAGETKPSTIEAQLASYEVSTSLPVYDASLPPSNGGAPATAFSSEKRESPAYPKARLLSVSRGLLRDWLPNLELGKSEKEGGDEEQQRIRQQFVDVVAGKTVLAREPDEAGDDLVKAKGFAPWSLCYAGHQFGSFAGQLGDGRAISILSTPPTAEVAAETGFQAIEFQLKGAGRTPYSRFADGLAVLRSSIREYLGAEAVAALKIPTSRALAIVHMPTVKVRRETMENAAIVTRVSGSWIRIGNFEQQAYREEYDSLLALSHYVGHEVFAFSDASPAGVGAPRSQALNIVREVSRRNAMTVAGWQTYGFMHGVMNTDNIAVNGATIDYGPYAFMDVFDPEHICNHSDDLGRYRFSGQPTMMLFAVHKLGEALAELIGCEVELAEKDKDGSGFVEAQKGWAEVGKSVMERWKERGTEEVNQVKADFVEIFRAEYQRQMRLRLGLTTADEGDFKLVSDWLDLLSEHELDFTRSHRLLSHFTSTNDPTFRRLLDAMMPSATSSSSASRDSLTTWFKLYEERLAKDGADAVSNRRARMDAVNPRFTLRQWVLEETIQKVEKSPDDGGIEQLERVLDMALNPFERYGEPEVKEGETDQGVCPTREETERARLCGTGPREFLGFQCSCSS
ncbi:UPF0061 family protein [Rhodotorula toruloides]|uniref:Selenoprotein O n=1 Tax=Rhodotorula toruloides TaxID=5286 RepID=A0A511KEM5_RHOTO|nr:UPF0061 family protein [Rhodotorula toruloides]